MGIVMSRLFETLFGSKEVRILILGLDNAGKTTILYRLQNESDEAVQTIPTIGFNVETLQYKNIKVRSGRTATMVVKERPNRICTACDLFSIHYTGMTSSFSQNLYASNYFLFSFKYGILEGKPVFVPIGDVITLIQMPLYSW